MIATILAASRLAVAITTAWPHVPAERAAPAALAIVVAVDGTPWSPDLVAAIAYHETHLRTDRIGSRGECGMGQVAHRRDRAARCLAARAYPESARQMVVALEEARAADQVVLMAGRVVAWGRPEEVLTSANLTSAYGLGALHGEAQGPFLDDPHAHAPGRDDGISPGAPAG